MIHCGDLFDVLPTLEANSLDACVTDPPYDLTANKRGGSGEASLNLASPAGRSRITTGGGFMGQKWDGTGVAFNVETWQAIGRVLKPGAHLLAFGGTRTFHRMTCAIEDAGFEIRDCLSWLYGSGFPKSLDVSKAIDKAAGASRTTIGQKMRPDGTYAVHSGGHANPGSFGFNGHSLEELEAMDAAGIEKTTNGRSVKANLARARRYRDAPQDMWQLTAPSTDAAKQWDGWGTALKPAWEPIILARKPFAGSVATNLLTHGTGALNVDACRIELDGGTKTAGGRGVNAGVSGWQPSSGYDDSQGRWPANVLLDEEAAEDLDEQAGKLLSGGRAHSAGEDVGGNSRALEGRTDPHLRGSSYSREADRGGASRFYYVAKPSREERDYGCERLPLQRSRSYEGGPIVSSDHPDTSPGGSSRARNSHPTVKPVELMRWLVKLVTPLDGTVLDPFMGSGTTGMACRYEHRQFVGIELEAEYFAIAEARISAVAPLFAEGA